MDNRDFSELISLFSNKITDGIYIASRSTHIILYANSQMRSMFDEEPVGKICYEFCTNKDCVCAGCRMMDREDVPFTWEIVRSENNPSAFLVTGMLHGDMIICRISNISDYYLLVDDVVEYSELILRQTERKGTVDSLTGLSNRNGFIKKRDTYYNKLENVAVAYFDINNMKLANDMYSHDAGDELLCFTADLLRELKTDGADIYRMGGDEFMIVIPDAAQRDVTELSEKWFNISKKKITKNGYICSIAFGCVLKAPDESFDAVMQRADKTMYEQKKKMK